jgi:hypothetical protein
MSKEEKTGLVVVQEEMRADFTKAYFSVQAHGFSRNFAKTCKHRPFRLFVPFVCNHIRIYLASQYF